MASASRRGILLLVALLTLLPPAHGDVLDDYVAVLTWPDKSETAQLAFTEERTFPFRRFPKRFEGQMYRAPNGDLAIIYPSPANIRLVICGDKILFDDGDGTLKPLPGNDADARAISDLLRGDIERLKADWTSTVEDHGLRLTPTLESIASELKYIDVTVEDQRVKTVEVHQRNQVVRLYKFGDLNWVEGDLATAPFAE
ncbi:hypothetical protein [Cerasicoccus frondis]|uniref:hypothetical protein n=1 Tax=Cerasicoccus frondis TaxID=490090 RepID=UPI0028526ACA|nr:hypothetical protein [Cerasicoccus frondis]